MNWTNQISDGLSREEERLDDLDEEFCVDINLEQKNGLASILNEIYIAVTVNIWL